MSEEGRGGGRWKDIGGGEVVEVGWVGGCRIGENNMVIGWVGVEG